LVREKEMKNGFVYEGDDWIQSGEVFTSPEKLKKIAEVIERTILIVEHWHYRGSRFAHPSLL
jgi:hypothetical protein